MDVNVSPPRRIRLPRRRAKPPHSPIIDRLRHDLDALECTYTGQAADANKTERLRAACIADVDGVTIDEIENGAYMLCTPDEGLRVWLRWSAGDGAEITRIEVGR